MQVYNTRSTMPSHSHSHSYSHPHSRATSPYTHRPTAHPNYASAIRPTSPPVNKPARPSSTALFPLPTAHPPPAKSQAQAQGLYKNHTGSVRPIANTTTTATYPSVSSVSAQHRSESPMEFWKPPQMTSMQARLGVGSGGRYGDEEHPRRARSSSAAPYVSHGGRASAAGRVYGEDGYGHGSSAASRPNHLQPPQRTNNFAQPPAASSNATWASAPDYNTHMDDGLVVPPYDVPPARKPYPTSYGHSGAGVSQLHAYPQHAHTHAREPPVPKRSDQARHWNAREATAARYVDPATVPSVHQAIGWWPDKRIQITWDLTTNKFPRYRRPFSQEELHNSPFDPPLQYVKIIIGEDASLDWAYELSTRHGADFISLQDLIDQIINLMHRDAVSLRQFERANLQTRWSIVRAYCRRTGKPLPQGMTDADLDDRVLRYFNDAMKATITSGATVGWTKLKVMDLLGSKIMFMGLCNVEQANKWLLMTTTRNNIPR